MQHPPITKLAGEVAQEQRDFDSAEIWYRKALNIEEKQGNEHGAAEAPITNWECINQEEQRDFEAAERMVSKILERFLNKQGNCNMVRQLTYATNWGDIAMQEQRDLKDSAEIWYRKALTIHQRKAGETNIGAATTYHQTGDESLRKRNGTSTRRRNMVSKSTDDIEEKQGNEASARRYHLSQVWGSSLKNNGTLTPLKNGIKNP